MILKIRNKDRGHLGNQETKLVLNEKFIIINDAINKTCSYREKEIFRLLSEEDLTLKEVGFLIESENGKQLTFANSVDIGFFTTELRDQSLSFEKRIWESMNNNIKGHLLTGNVLDDLQEKRLVEWLDTYFRKKDCFLDKELKELKLDRISIESIFQKDFYSLSDYETLKLNLLALSRTYPKEYKHPETGETNVPVKGILTPVRIFQIKKKAAKKIRKKLKSIAGKDKI